MSRFTRRSVIALIALGGLAPVAYLARGRLRSSSNSNTPPSVGGDFSRQLTQALNEKLGPSCNGQFSIQKVDLTKSEGITSASVVVRLDWPPGMRQRPITAAGSDETQARLAVVDSCVAIFGPLGKAV